MEYTSISYHCPFPAPGQPREFEAIVEGPHEYARFLIYLAANVYPGRTDLRMGGKTLCQVSKRELPGLIARGIPLLDLPPLPKGHVERETTGDERIQFSRRQLALSTLNAMQTYWAQAAKLEKALGPISALAEILEEFNVGVDHSKNIGVDTLDRLLQLLTNNIEGEDQ